MSNIVIAGATSAIAQQIARRYAERGDRILLCGRTADKLEVLARDLLIRGAKTVDIFASDLADEITHPELAKKAVETLVTIDVLLVAHGSLTDQQRAQKDIAYAFEEYQVNLLSHVSLISLFANVMEAQRNGCLAVIGSVAGDRGRQSNYFYGSAKAALETFTQGLRNRMYRCNVSVVLIKPGFVDTPMTAQMAKNRLFAAPQEVAADIIKAIDKAKPELYTPWFWRYIMLVIRTIPERIFIRLNL